MNAELIAAIVAVSTLTGGALIWVGRLQGRFERHEEDTGRRLGDLEAANDKRITREELDARFGALKGQLDTITQLLQNLQTKVAP